MNRVSSELQQLQHIKFLLKSAISNEVIFCGAAVHGFLLKSRLVVSTYLANHLVSLYASCKQTLLARQVFDEIHQPNVFSYNALLAAYARASLPCLASELFSQIPSPDLVSFNTLLSAYSDNHVAALRIFRQMLETDISVDAFTLSTVISSLNDREFIVGLHGIVVSAGFSSSISVNNSLIGGYSRSGLLREAERIFSELGVSKNVVSWNCMIMGYGLNKEGRRALELMKNMVVPPDMFTVASMLTAFSASRDLTLGAQLHSQLLKNGSHGNAHIGSGLVDLYAKCGLISDAEKVFAEVLEPDLILWNTMISGYSLEEGYSEEALGCFREMQRRGLLPDDASFVCASSACSNLSSPLQSRQLHAVAIKSNLSRNHVSVNNALIALYSKSGGLEDARKVFNRMPHRNSISFNSMIAGFSQHGQGEEGLALFEEMLAAGEQPSAVTFVSILSVCAHCGNVSKGRSFFDAMETQFNVRREKEHYSCMIDLLARAGNFKEAEEMIEKMPFDPGKIAWAALLGACKTHGNISLGEKVAQFLLRREPFNASPYVVLAGMYIDAGRWEEAAEVRRMMRNQAVRKSPGCSWIELKKTVNVFVADDSSHPRAVELRRVLVEWSEKMRASGYVGDPRRLYHSEKLAVALGMLSTEDGAPILVVKNLRICEDCHDTIKLLGSMTKRRITVRDNHRFHHFSDGVCSCGDYW